MAEDLKNNQPKTVVDARLRKKVIVVWCCVVAAVVLVIGGMILLSATLSGGEPDNKKVMIDGVNDMLCQKGNTTTCTGELTLQARLDDKGKIATSNVNVVAMDGSFNKTVAIEGRQIKPDEYARLLEASKIDADKTQTVAELQDGRRKINYEVRIGYALDENDRKILRTLNEEYQKEQERKRAEEEAQRLEAEKREAERKREEEKAKQAERNKEKMRTTAHSVCERYMEQKFFPLKVKVHSILGVGLDKAYNDYTWSYGVNITVSSNTGGSLKYTAMCMVGSYSSDYEKGEVIDFGLQEGWK